MNTRFLSSIALAGVVTLFGSVSTGLAQSTATVSTPKFPIRMGYVPAAIYAPLYVGLERGYFAAEGIDLQLTAIQGGSDSVVQLAAGNFDAAAAGVGAGLLNAASLGLEFKIVAPMHNEQPPLTTSLVISASRAGDIKTIADLKGKTVSINATGAATEYWLQQALIEGGLTTKDIKVSQVGFANVAAALQSGAIDGAMLGEPFTTQLVQQGLVKVLADDFIHGFYATYVFMGTPLVTDHRDVAVGFMRAFLKACRDLQAPGAFADPAIATIIQKYTKIPAAIIEGIHRPYFQPNGVIPVADLNTLQTYFLQTGELSYKAPIDLTKFIDTSLAADAVKSLGVFAEPTAAATMSGTMAATLSATTAATAAPTMAATP